VKRAAGTEAAGRATRTPEFVAHVVECLRELGPVEARRMFGGWGLYHRDAFFALIVHDTLYLKTDEANRAEFDARALEPFTFEKGGETIVTSYRAAPEEALESARAMAQWAKSAYGAALRKTHARREPRSAR
jgi:DNA transformation protein and related proteins